MPDSMLLLLLVVVALITLGVQAVCVVPRDQALVIERLGRYSRTLYAGRHLLIPSVDRVRRRVDLRGRTVTVPAQQVGAVDRSLRVDQGAFASAVVHTTVTDPRAAVYDVVDLDAELERVATSTLRDLVGPLEPDEVARAARRIEGRLLDALRTETGRWGVRVDRTELTVVPAGSAQASGAAQPSGTAAAAVRNATRPDAAGAVRGAGQNVIDAVPPSARREA